MLKNKNSQINIKEIYSVTLIRPDRSEKTKTFDKFIPRYQLIYKLSGEVTTTFNGKTFRITPGCVYVIPKCDNAEYRIERAEIGDCIDIIFDTDLPPADELTLVNFSSDEKMKNLFMSVYRLWLTKPDGYCYKVLSIVYEILYETVLKSANYTPNHKYKKTEKGVEYLQKHLYDKNIDYTVPSELCGISYTYFKKLFIEKFGMPPVKYVVNMRLERGAELLSTDLYSVGEIARLCGFENVYYFSKKFKEKYLMSPSEYKKKLSGFE